MSYIPEIPKSWKPYLNQEREKRYFKELEHFLSSEIFQGKIIYPASEKIFSALDFVEYDEVKVVIIGQDPYHGEGQAHGLAFSVPHNCKIPPSLRNIYKEIDRDFGYTIPKHGNLSEWARQGVLLLNTVLTVEQAKAASHKKKGWELFTQKIIESIALKDGIVFMLWGAHAHKFEKYLDPKKHYILKSVHPSPLSAHRGFIGCGHFSLCNQFLDKNDKAKINWQLAID